LIFGGDIRIIPLSGSFSAAAGDGPGFDRDGRSSMWVAIAIAGGVIICTFIGSLFDYLGKKAKAKGDLRLGETVKSMEARVAALESRIDEKDARIAQLETDLGFLNRLIEDKTKR
jgi:hypothetical protein